jgi:hypothetical protein
MVNFLRSNGFNERLGQTCNMECELCTRIMNDEAMRSAIIDGLGCGQLATPPIMDRFDVISTRRMARGSM